MLEAVIVPKEPARPVYSEHSFVSWRAPLRADAADVGATARPSQPSEVSVTARRHPVAGRARA